MPKKLETNSALKDRQQYHVIIRDEKAKGSYEVGGRTIDVGQSGVMLNDRGVADELFEKHSPFKGDGQLHVIPVEKQESSGRKRTFLVSLPKNYKRGE